MYFIYNCSVYIASFLLKIAAFFSPKLKLFVNGRTTVFDYLKDNLSNKSNLIWVHTASLGEYEQGLPVIEKLKLNYPNYKMLVTFFSPSGYEIKKNTPTTDYITYLPLDTKFNAKKFIELTNPKLAIFVKYEIWPNYLSVLKEKNIPTLLISALFKKEQIFFKSYGNFMKKSLLGFTQIFVQDDASKKLLETINIKNTIISGDTRFDRVLEILKRDNYLDFMTSFKGDKKCFVAGSTWPEDEAILVEYINSSNDSIKFILAPHTIKKEAIKKLQSSLFKKTILYSEIENQDISGFDVLIVDTIGILTKIYSYADIAFVGGGFATGLHNTLEPAVFGTPVLIGPKYKGFKEAEELVSKKGIISIKDSQNLVFEINKLLNHQEHYLKTKEINTTYISENSGATTKIIDFITSVLH